MINCLKGQSSHGIYELHWGRVYLTFPMCAHEKDVYTGIWQNENSESQGLARCELFCTITDVRQNQCSTESLCQIQTMSDSPLHESTHVEQLLRVDFEMYHAPNHLVSICIGRMIARLNFQIALISISIKPKPLYGLISAPISRSLSSLAGTQIVMHRPLCHICAQYLLPHLKYQIHN